MARKQKNRNKVFIVITLLMIIPSIYGYAQKNLKAKAEAFITDTTSTLIVKLLNKSNDTLYLPYFSSRLCKMYQIDSLKTITFKLPFAKDRFLIEEKTYEFDLLQLCSTTDEACRLLEKPSFIEMKKGDFMIIKMNWSLEKDSKLSLITCPLSKVEIQRYLNKELFCHDIEFLSQQVGIKQCIKPKVKYSRKK